MNAQERTSGSPGSDSHETTRICPTSMTAQLCSTTDFYERVRDAATSAPAEWPWLAYVASVVPDTLSPPPTWALFTDEIRRFVVDEVGVPDDSALDTALAVQHYMLPASGRTFPVDVVLDHDFPAWLRDVNAVKDAGQRSDWEHLVEPLSTYGPATMTIDDPRLVSSTNLGHGSVLDNYKDWELEAPVSRAVAGIYTV